MMGDLGTVEAPFVVLALFLVLLSEETLETKLFLDQFLFSLQVLRKVEASVRHVLFFAERATDV